MYLFEAPAGAVTNGALHGHQVINGKVILGKQYWWHTFREMGWRDITPPWWGRSFAKQKDLKRVLHVYHSGLGDMLFLTPVFKAFARKYPGVVQDVQTGPKGARILENNPWISEITVSLERPDHDHIEKYDDAIKYDGILSKYPESELRNIYDLMADWAGVELEEEEKKPDLYFDESEMRVAEELCQSWDFNHDTHYVVMQYDASSNVRNIPHSTLVELAEKITGDGYKVVLFGRSNLGKKGSWLCKKCGRRNFAVFSGRLREIGVRCACGQYDRLKRGDEGIPGLYFTDSENVSIRTIAILISRGAAYVGPDSCGLHMAAASGRPSLGIFFSFDGDLRMRYYRSSICMQIDVPCGPCFQHGVKKCKNHNKDGFPRCIDKVKADEIYERFKKLVRAELPGRTLPFRPSSARMCPVCGSPNRSFVRRKKSVCYCECLCCDLIYTDVEVKEPSDRIACAYLHGMPKLEEMTQRESAKILHRRFFHPGATVLEVGCSKAHALDELRRLGWDVEGIDISVESAEREKRYPWLAGRVSRCAFEDFETEKKFTLIWMNKVFERFHKPREIFGRVHSLLDNDGIFALQTYDGDLWREAHCRTSWEGINNSYAGENSIIPNERSLKFLASELGFEFLGKEKQRDPECLFIKLRKAPGA